MERKHYARGTGEYAALTCALLVAVLSFRLFLNSLEEGAGETILAAAMLLLPLLSFLLLLRRKQLAPVLMLFPLIFHFSTGAVLVAVAPENGFAAVLAALYATPAAYFVVWGFLNYRLLHE